MWMWRLPPPGGRGDASVLENVFLPWLYARCGWKSVRGSLSGGGRGRMGVWMTSLRLLYTKGGCVRGCGKAFVVLPVWGEGKHPCVKFTLLIPLRKSVCLCGCGKH